jgi:hypothetical protein
VRWRRKHAIWNAKRIQQIYYLFSFTIREYNLFLKIFNSTYEMETALQYIDKIRIAQLDSDTSDTALEEPRLNYKLPWSQLQAAILPDFSALCLLYAERLLDQVPDHPPIGLIQATYENSNIEAWVSTAVFDVCNSTQSPVYILFHSWFGDIDYNSKGTDRVLWQITQFGTPWFTH